MASIARVFVSYAAAPSFSCLTVWMDRYSSFFSPFFLLLPPPSSRSWQIAMDERQAGAANVLPPLLHHHHKGRRRGSKQRWSSYSHCCCLSKWVCECRSSSALFAPTPSRPQLWKKEEENSLNVSHQRRNREKESSGRGTHNTSKTKMYWKKEKGEERKYVFTCFSKIVSRCLLACLRLSQPKQTDCCSVLTKYYEERDFLSFLCLLLFLSWTQIMKRGGIKSEGESRTNDGAP